MHLLQPALVAARRRAPALVAWPGPEQLHNQRVSALADQLAIHYGLPAAQRRLVVWGARWHDLGKLELGPRLVNKPGPLTIPEWALMRRHPRLGAVRASRLGAPLAVARMIDAHHERWDGRGYGSGLARRQIPLGAQIISLADVFDAMTSERPYKRPMSVGASLERMAADRERAFHPELLDLALALFEAAAPRICLAA
ncbi:MAG: HD domain-containing protein [Chloroflexales bacterium]|nr:HD domain-containing protein [Chloroflexales bacterium]